MKRENLSNIFASLLLGMMVALFAACSGDSGAKKLFPVVKDGKWGYMNNQGKIVIEPQFDAARDFHDGLALVSKFDKTLDDVTMQPKNKDGYIDETGKFVIEPQFVSQSNTIKKSHDDFSEGLAVVQTDWTLDKTIPPGTLQRNYAVIDKTGKIVFKLDPKYRVTDNFTDGLLLFMDESTKKYGYLDKTGKVAIEPKYITAFPFSDGLAAVSQHDERYGKKDIYHGYIDATGKTVIEFQFKEALSFSEGLARVISEDGGDNFEFIDKTGKMAINRRFKQAGAFHDGLAATPNTTMYEFIDKTGATAVAAEPGTARTNFSEGLAIITDDKKKLQIIDESGDIVAPVDEGVRDGRYETLIDDFQGGLSRIIGSDDKGVATLFYINKKGKIVWKDKMDR